MVEAAKINGRITLMLRSDLESPPPERHGTRAVRRSAPSVASAAPKSVSDRMTDRQRDRETDSTNLNASSGANKTAHHHPRTTVNSGQQPAPRRTSTGTKHSTRALGTGPRTCSLAWPMPPHPGPDL
ncbi:uncharacterized protein M421DRAFT_4311 [Didymella exigua CBS 183.55]|uniref:Uncharacterized protein n=1 Tax=Didymella exigua CBS 183.55 TaxID=1150837 RepID=A0A6A5RU97_9PLEO|nr:uncharacterized protein M421DRAFT_4311 [Didymella exigua CBS 183.55]KAF1929886.1 hypothetical protein M421DRAFT_4311 [Didymella exigua CBS 183.55]